VTAIAANGCTATSAPVIVSANGCTPPAIPTITVSGSTVLTPGQTVTLTSSAAGGWLWSTGATTQSIVVTAAGTYTVRAYNAGNCFSTSDPVTVLLVTARLAANKTVAVSPEELTLYPNPAKDWTRLDFTAAQAGISRIRLVDLTGRICHEREYPTVAGQNRIEIDTQGLAAGCYVLQFSGEQERSLRLIVRN
jgi:hypothetical protein